MATLKCPRLVTVMRWEMLLRDCLSRSLFLGKMVEDFVLRYAMAMLRWTIVVYALLIRTSKEWWPPQLLFVILVWRTKMRTSTVSLAAIVTICDRSPCLSHCDRSPYPNCHAERGGPLGHRTPVKMQTAEVIRGKRALRSMTARYSWLTRSDRR